MTLLTKEIDSTQLHAEGGDRLHSAIASALPSAAKLIEMGEFIRIRYAQGNGNNSLASTVAGSLQVASGTVSRLDLSEEEPPALFFENLRDTLRSLKYFWHR